MHGATMRIHKILSRVQPTRCDFYSIYSCTTLYMFQTVLPSIIRSETCIASYRNKYTEKSCILLAVLCEYISDARTYECCI